MDDKGPWYIRKIGEGKIEIYSEDFTHDVVLALSGDFEDEDQRIEYASMIARKLSGKPLDGSEP